MAHSRPAQLQHLITIGEKMLGLAQTRDWMKLTELEFHRRVLIDSYFERQVTVNEVAAVEKMIKRAMDIHEKIVALVEKDKQNMRIELAQMNTGSKALAAYAKM